MILSDNAELRLHLPSNAIDEITLLQGVLDNSEKDFLKDKLGGDLYDKLCEFYQGVAPAEFCAVVYDGTYTQNPWAELLLNAQRMVANDAMARYAYQQAISVNSMGVNVANSNDYDTADSKLLDKGVAAFRKEAMVALNNTLILLENWAIAEEPTDEQTEIVTLWKKSKYYYLHAELLIPTCAALQRYLDIYESRDKFIRLLPDLHFIQDEYITDLVGEEVLAELKSSDDVKDKRILNKALRLMVLLLEERTAILPTDKTRRAKAHDEAVSVQTSLLALLRERKAAQEETDKAEETEDAPSPTRPNDRRKDCGFKNNQRGAKVFVAPMLY